jgi:TPR repeat protein
MINMRYYLFVLFTMLLIVLQASSAFAVAPIKGVVTAKRGDTLKVEFQVNKQVVPQPGDQVEFFQMLEGYPAEAGTGKVVKNDGNAVWVQTNDSHPDLTMNALIHATGIAKKKKPVKKTSTPPLHPCDELAGDPWDDKRIGPSVKFPSIQTDRAITACEEAAREYPAADRFQFQLARAYTADKQYKKALFYYNMAAVPGNYPAAQYNLGAVYHFGDGVAKDSTKALEWFFKAAKQNYLEAQYRIGWMYDHGYGVAEDDVEAFKWYEKAAIRGHALAQLDIGVMYRKGNGVPKNMLEGLKWYKKSAAQGNAEAEYNLGTVYEFGRGVEKNYVEAAKWYRKAAEQDFGDALYNLAYLYYRGLGVPESKKRALNDHEACKKALAILGE